MLLLILTQFYQVISIEPVELGENDRNISDTYTGTWSSPEWAHLHHFTSTSGNFSLILQNLHTNIELDVVEGTLTIQDGFFFLGKTVKYIIQGLFHPQDGFAFLIANPLTNLVVQDYKIPIDSFRHSAGHTTGTSNATFRYLGEPIHNYSSTTMNFEELSPCYLTLAITFEKNVDQSVRKIDNGDFNVPRPYRKLSGGIASPNCNVTIEINGTTMLIEKLYSKSISYNIGMIFVTCIQIAALINLLNTVHTQASYTALSPYTFAIQALLDANICLSHLTIGLSKDPVSNIFASTAFFKFTLFAVFEVQLIYQIWKAQHPTRFADAATTQREFKFLYLSFYSSLMIGLFLQYALVSSRFYPLFVFTGYSFWCTQIFHSIFRGTEQPLPPKYVIPTGITRLFLPLYFTTYPGNFWHVQPNLFFSVALAAWTALQLTILVLQHYYGPHFMLPNGYLPERYNYTRQVVIPPDTDCAICRSSVQQNDYMVTPCNHFFHSNCLYQWIVIKLECPSCRGILPAP